MKTLKNILFFLCIFFPFLGIVGFVLDYFTYIHIIYASFFWFWLVLFFIGLIVFFRVKRRFWITFLSGIVLISMALHSLFTFDFAISTEIENSDYHAEVQRYGYKITQKNYFFKRTIAEKQSTTFAADNVKIGIVLFPKLKLLKETDNELILENNGVVYKPDTLQKLDILKNEAF